MISRGCAPPIWRIGEGRHKNSKPRNHTESAIQTLLDRLDGVRATGDHQWIAKCPAHDDSSPSLSIKEDGGTILLHDFAGCSVLDVVTAIGMELSDLFPRREGNHPNGHERLTFDARQVLHAKEALLIRLYAQDAIDGVLTDADLDRLRLAESRIAEAINYV